MKAYELLGSPEKWTQGYYAKDQFGVQVSAFSDRAACFCVLGALYRLYRSSNEAIPLAKVERLLPRGMSIGDWNDTPGRTFQEVRDLLIKADV